MTDLRKEARELIESVRGSHPGAHALARVVSLAARVEPALVRRARLELLPHLGAGDEADLWFSPLVQARSPLAIVFAPEVTELLRLELAKDQTMLGRAWALVKQVHAKTSPVTHLEEEVTYLALSDQRDAPEKIRALLLSVAQTMVEDKGRGLAQWALRALPRLPEEVRGSEAAWALAVGAGARLGGRRILTGEAPDTMSQSMLRWVLPSDHKQTAVGVRLVEAGVEVSEPPAGTHVIQLPKTDPLLLEVSWGEGPNATVRQVTLRPGQTQIVETGSLAEVSISTPTGDTFSIRREYEFDVYIGSTYSVGDLKGDIVSRLQKEKWKGRRLKVTVYQPMGLHPDLAYFSEEDRRASGEAYQANRDKAGRNRRASRKIVEEIQEETLKTLDRRLQESSGDEENDPRLIRVYLGATELPPELEKYVDVDFRDESRFEDNYRRLLVLIKDEPFIEPPESPERSEPAKLYYVYAPQDENLKDQLVTHLSVLRREGIIKEWHEQLTGPGSDWRKEIDEHLDSADLILLLVSLDFLAAEFTYGVEMRRALERSDAGEARVIPVILRPCEWMSTPLGRFQALPLNAQPITEWSNPDEAFQLVAESIRRIATEIAGEKDAKKAPDTGHRPLVYISHSARDYMSSALIDRLTNALQNVGYDFFLDRARLQPGDDWRQELNEQMERADAAIVIFSEAAMKSQWVFREVEVFSRRRESDENFLLIPVLLEGVEMDMAFERVGRNATRDMQAIRAEGSPEETVSRIVEALAPLRERGTRQLSYEERLEKLVADCLRDVPDSGLASVLVEQANEPLGASVTSLQELLARRIVRGGLEQLPETLQLLSGYLDESTMQRVIELISPTWVNPEAAAAVRRVTMQPPGQRALCVNCEREFTGRMYISRASEKWPPWDPFFISSYWSEDGSDVLREIKYMLQQKLNLDTDFPDEDLERLLAERAGKFQEPIFVLFHPPLPPPELIENIRRAYPTLTLFLMTGEQLPHPDELRLDHVEMIHPPLAPGEEEKALDTYNRLREMFDRPSQK